MDKNVSLAIFGRVLFLKKVLIFKQTPFFIKSCSQFV